MTTVWFVRHGESEGNVNLPTTDPAQVPLTWKGRKQAKQVAQAFVRRPSLIVVSTFLRAKETADPLRERYPDVEYAQDELVCDFIYLSLAEQKKTTKQERRPLVEAYWERLDPDYVDGKGTESFDQFICRVYKAIKLLKQMNEEFIAVFSHEQFILAALWLLLNNPEKFDKKAMRQFHSFLDANSVPNGAIVEMRFSASDDWEMPLVRIQKGHLGLECAITE